MQKIVINRCYGGFGLSAEAEILYGKKSGFDVFHYKQTKYSHQGDGNLYEKVAAKNASLFVHTFKKDRGASFTDEVCDDSYWYSGELERTDPILIDVVEELGEAANGDCANLDVVEIPDGVEWHIDDYDGLESIHEQHRSW